MITKQDVLKLHELSLLAYGGASGLRDEGLLDAAVARPYQTFDGNDLYETVIEKAAAIFESIVMNHPFNDGNKRTGFLAMFTMLDAGGIALTAPQDEAYNFTIAVATGEKNYDDIVEWLRQNTAGTA
jgi:death on curing protein